MTERRRFRRRRYRQYTTSVSDIGSMFSNIASRFASTLTRKNRDHLVVPINYSPIRSSSKNSPVDLENITTAFGLNKRKSTFRKRGAKKRPSLAQ